MKHGLPESLVLAVCEQESDWKPWAVRYEPGFMSKYVAPLYTNRKIDATEAYCRSMSWGLMQVMGQVARENGFNGAFLPELCDPEAGLEIGCIVLKGKLDGAGGDLQRGLLAWNGGGSLSYPMQVLAKRSKYEVSNHDTVQQAAAGET